MLRLICNAVSLVRMFFCLTVKSTAAVGAEIQVCLRKIVALKHLKASHTLGAQGAT